MKVINDIYKTTCGVKLPIRIYYPENHNGDCVVNIHGGGWQAIKTNSDWDGSWMDYQAQYYAEKGCIGIVFSYRSIDITDDTDILDLYSDCVDAMKYINNKINYSRMIVTGDSAGGHLAVMLGFDKNIKTDIIVACNPVLNLTDEKWRYTSKNESNLKAASPLYNVVKTNTKFLLIHGDSDTVVDCNITKNFYNMLLENGIDAELIIIPGARHAFILKNYISTDEQVLEYMAMIDKIIF